VIIAAA